MDQNEALTAAQAITDKQCGALLTGLDAVLDEPTLSRAINAVFGPVTQGHKEHQDLVRLLTSTTNPPPPPPPPPPPATKPWETGRPANMRTVWADDFDTLDTSVWDVYDKANGQEKWGQSSRSGFYSKSQVWCENSALVIEQKPDPAGRRSDNGRPGWLTGFVTTRGKKYFPVDCFMEWECEFDTSTPGNWWAPWWTRLHDAASNEERDNEWFGNYPDYMGFAYHARSDAGSLVTNLDSRVLKRRNNVAVAKPGARHRYGWWTRKCTEHAGYRKHTRYVDGKAAMELCTWELAQKGQPVDKVLNSVGKGIDIAICGQAENINESGMLYRSGEKGPYYQKVHWMAVSVPT